MDWGLAIIAVEILLLAAGWVLYQQARSELTARAAETPVLAEVRSLQESIAKLLEDVRLESVQTSAQLEARCREARDLLSVLDRRLEEINTVPLKAVARRRAPAASPVQEAPEPETEPVPEAASESDVTSDATPTNPRYADVYDLADRGFGAEAIAQQTGMSVGEVELVLGLRPAAS